MFAGCWWTFFLMRRASSPWDAIQAHHNANITTLGKINDEMLRVLQRREDEISRDRMMMLNICLTQKQPTPLRFKENPTAQPPAWTGHDEGEPLEPTRNGDMVSPGEV